MKVCVASKNKKKGEPTSDSEDQVDGICPEKKANEKKKKGAGGHCPVLGERERCFPLKLA